MPKQTENNEYKKSQYKDASQLKAEPSQPSSPIPSSPTQSPPQPPLQSPQQPPPTPYPPQPPVYYPPQPPPPSVYSWEMFPHVAREILEDKKSRKPMFAVIGILLLITAAFEFPIAAMLTYYSSSDGLDFGGTLTLEGKVTDKDGRNLSDVTVSILGTGLSSISNDQGNYRISNAPTGVWKVKASLEGRKEETHRVLLHPAFADTLDFNLEEGDGEREYNDLWFFISLSILMLMLSSFIIAGSFYSFRRRRFSVAFVGAILGMFTMAPPTALWFIPSIFFMGAFGFFLSTYALILIVKNRKYFMESKSSPLKKDI